MIKLKLSGLTISTALILSSFSLSLESFADQTVRIPQNQNTFTLQLNANATTGFQWFLENYNPTYFTYLGYHYIAPTAPSSGPKLMGAPGMAQFTFQVNPAFHQGALTSKIHLVYGQPWDMTASTDTTITLVSQPLDSTPVTPAATMPTNTSVPAGNNTDHKNLLSDASDDDSTPNMATVNLPENSSTADNQTSSHEITTITADAPITANSLKNPEPTPHTSMSHNQNTASKNAPPHWLSLPANTSNKNTDQSGS